MLEQTHTGGEVLKATGRKMFNLKEAMYTWWGTIRSSVIGFVIGVLPGAGATIASAITYMMEKHLTDTEGTFGKGDIRGVAAPGGGQQLGGQRRVRADADARRARLGTTAVMVGALSLYNITPGPLLFEQQPDLVWGLIASMFIGNVMLLVMNIPMVGLFTRMLTVPNWILVPAHRGDQLRRRLRGARDDLRPRADGGLGIFGYLLRKLDLPMAPLILGFVLGDMMEQNLRRALSISNGDVGILYGSGITIGLWIAAAVMLVVPLLLRWKRNNKLIPMP